MLQMLNAESVKGLNMNEEIPNYPIEELAEDEACETQESEGKKRRRSRKSEEKNKSEISPQSISLRIMPNKEKNPHNFMKKWLEAMNERVGKFERVFTVEDVALNT